MTVLVFFVLCEVLRLLAAGFSSYFGLLLRLMGPVSHCDHFFLLIEEELDGFAFRCLLMCILPSSWVTGGLRSVIVTLRGHLSYYFASSLENILFKF